MRYKVVVSGGIFGFVALMGLYYLQRRRHYTQRLTRSDIAKEDAKKDQAMLVKKCTYQDLTTSITAGTVVFPGDPCFSAKTVAAIGEKSSFKLCELYMCNHMGTHIDFPAHVLEGGKTSSDYPLDRLFGEGIIIEAPMERRTISGSFVKQQNILENDFVFFKTSNSAISKQGEFKSEFVFIEPDAARALLDKKVRVVGIDYISVDAHDAEELPVHKILLQNEVLIVENLELRGVNPGRCKIFIAPLNVPDMDGLPARVFISR